MGRLDIKEDAYKGSTQNTNWLQRYSIDSGCTQKLNQGVTRTPTPTPG